MKARGSDPPSPDFPRAETKQYRYCPLAPSSSVTDKIKGRPPRMAALLLARVGRNSEESASRVHIGGNKPLFVHGFQFKAT